MITWVQKRFKDRSPGQTDTKEIDLWLHNIQGEVKHFSMVAMGSLILAVVGYMPTPEAYTYTLPEEEEQAVENFMDTFVDD